jgi:hypothetical protein
MSKALTARLLHCIQRKCIIFRPTYPTSIITRNNIVEEEEEEVKEEKKKTNEEDKTKTTKK